MAGVELLPLGEVVANADVGISSVARIAAAAR
jgi:hypothetical protein